jgi:hypothetical protein
MGSTERCVRGGGPRWETGGFPLNVPLALSFSFFFPPSFFRRVEYPKGWRGEKQGGLPHPCC